MAVLDLRPVWALSGGETLAQLDALHAQIAVLQTRRVQLIGHLDQLGYAGELGAIDTVHLLAARHRLDAPAVRRDVRLANALHKYGHVLAAMPEPATGLAPAVVSSAELAPAVVASASDEQRGLSDSARQALVATGADESAVTGPAPGPGPGPGDGPGDGSGDGDGPGNGPGDGPGHGEGPGGGGFWLHPGQVEAIVGSLEQVPVRVDVNARVLVDAEAALVAAARVLGPRELRALGAKARDLLDADGPEPAEDKAAAREALWLRPGVKGVRFGGFLANENAELLQVLVHAGAAPVKTPDGGLDPRSLTRRRADGLIGILHAAAGTGRVGTGRGGIKPHITVTMNLDDLKAAGVHATGEVLFGDGLSAGAVRRLACDAGIIPLVLGGASQPLDLGREERFVTPALRRALIARDRGCVIDGCGAPVDQTDAHHLVHWIDGGITAITNLVLVCKPHHRSLHRGEWAVAITNGQLHVTRPHWADPTPTDPADLALASLVTVTPARPVTAQAGATPADHAQVAARRAARELRAARNRAAARQQSANWDRETSETQPQVRAGWRQFGRQQLGQDSKSAQTQFQGQGSDFGHGQWRGQSRSMNRGGDPAGGEPP